MSVNLSNEKKQEASLNNELFFNYSNIIEKNVSFNNGLGILEVALADKSCTAKFGKHPDQTMNISSIKIVKGYVNAYEEVAKEDDGEIILTYIPASTSFSEYGQVCIKLKGLDDDDPRINKFFANMLNSDNKIKNGVEDINLDHLIPNGSKFFYATTDDTVLEMLSKASNVVLFDNYNIVYCPQTLLNEIEDGRAGDKKVEVTSLSINHSGSANDNEEFITECTPIGADVNTEDWSKPGDANTIFSFFAKGQTSKNIAWEKITKGEVFEFVDYTDEDGNKGDDLFIYIMYHIIIVILILIPFLALSVYFAPSGKYYKEGVLAGKAETLGTEK